MTTDGHAGGPPRAEELSHLIQAIAEDQDRQAFTALFQHFAPRLKAFLMRSGMASSTAEDLMQETMVSVWRKAAYFDPSRASPATWIFVIARNLRIDHFRHMRLQDDKKPQFAEEADPSPTGETLAITAERDAILRKVLDKLPAEQQSVVRLSFFSDLPHPDIARKLGIPLGTVKSRLRLAMSRLREALDDQS